MGHVNEQVATAKNKLKYNGLIMSRVEGKAFVNVPRFITYHSPDGFEFGYGGSGPADLALNVVYVLSDGNRELADRLHQDFKFAFIANVPKEGDKILFETMMDWIREKI